MTIEFIDMKTEREKYIIAQGYNHKPVEDFKSFWGICTDEMKNYIELNLNTEEEVFQAIKSLHDQLMAVDWKTFCEEKQAKIEIYANEIIHCPKCQSSHARKQLSHAPYCDACYNLIVEERYRYCAVCDCKYLKVKNGNDNLCADCWTGPRAREATRVIAHLNRARELNLTATLTTKQWLRTLEYFDYKCAYCLKTYTAMEHYIPLGLNGAGTTADNCLPSCSRCNRTKKDKHPDKFKHLFPAENIARIKAYFASL